ncbi:hypothetical protein C8F04DRAFT_1278069 [Mycena alexandri]|uniref:Bacteriophage T5 Orf172 DNA-binding domain-containing protein n=1 Tax=Mycena alexandri TaxID=1745969 RepID=A0AAD6WRD1_9AGAR|nr:hypothetical protein C8F04DRAFT_1278069 [Mycena alexandri]
MVHTSAPRRRAAAAAAASCRLCRAAQQQINLHVANGDRSRALRVITRSPKPKQQTELHLQNRGLYARDGVPGHLYCCASVRTSIYDAFTAATISVAQFRHALRVKLGVAKDVFARRENYAICDSQGQTHIWLFFVSTQQRYRIERLIHLDFLSRARHSIRACSGCYKRHREYWRFIDVGSFRRIRARVRALLARIGEAGAQIIPLEDYHLVF